MLGFGRRRRRSILRGPAHDGALVVLRAMLGTEDPHARVLALGALEGSDIAGHVRDGRHRAAGADARVRVAAARALATEDPTRTIPLLVRSLDDEDADVRRAVARSLGGIGASSAEPVLAALVPSSHSRRGRCSRSSSCRQARHPTSSVATLERKRLEPWRTSRRRRRSIPKEDDRARLLRDSLMARARLQALDALQRGRALGRGRIDQVRDRQPLQP